METGETVAIKKVFQDKRYKNRELQIMTDLNHGNVIKLKHYFFSPGDNVKFIIKNLLTMIIARRRILKCSYGLCP